jgi:hypothetical protein
MEINDEIELRSAGLQILRYYKASTYTLVISNECEKSLFGRST